MNPDNSSDRGHPNPSERNTSVVLYAKIIVFCEFPKFFRGFFLRRGGGDE